MNAHAQLGPSSAERWISCPASVKLSKRLPGGDAGSSYAHEGSVAHELAALYVERAFKLTAIAESGITAWGAKYRNEFTTDQLVEMDRHCRDYVKFVQFAAAKMSRKPLLAAESRVNTGVEDCWGTADCVVYDDRGIHVIDFKYGTGVAVEAEDNPQLKLYALGVLNEFSDLLGEYHEISVSIFQPRIGVVKTVVMRVDELEKWRDEVVKPAAKLALSDGAPFGPSIEACRWCPVAGRCDAQAQSVWETDFGDDPDLMSPEQIADALDAAPRIKSWLGQLEKAALKMAYSDGVPIPGWKVVRSGGRRSIPEAAHAVQRLIDAGYPASSTSQVKMIGLSDLERLVALRGEKTGRDHLNEILGDLIVKSEGSESLVPESDNRPAINPETEARKVFEKEDAK